MDWKLALPFIISFVTTLVLTPVFIRVAHRFGIVDKPGPRRVNTTVKARLGGPGMFLGFVLSMVVTWSVYGEVRFLPAIASGAAIMFLVGLIDDIKSTRAGIKLGLQFLAATVAYVFNIRIEFISNPFTHGLIELPVWVSYGITVLWIVGMTNAVNLIDGLDGLAAGIICIASMTFFLVALNRHQIPSALIAAGMVGATSGYLRWNYYPSKIIMGDGGAYFLGYMAAVIAITGAFKSTTAVTLLIPVMALGIPIFDTSFAIIRRAKSGNPIMAAPDKGHLHHRMLAAGIQHRDAVIICHLITLCLSAVSLALIKAWLLAIILFAATCGIVLLLIGVGKLKKSHTFTPKSSEDITPESQKSL